VMFLASFTAVLYTSAEWARELCDAYPARCGHPDQHPALANPGSAGYDLCRDSSPNCC